VAGKERQGGDDRRLTKAERRDQARIQREEIQRKMARRRRNRSIGLALLGASGYLFAGLTLQISKGNVVFAAVLNGMYTGGDLLCVFYSGGGHVTLPSKDWPTGGRISYIRSMDDGGTWTAPAVIIDTPQPAALIDLRAIPRLARSTVVTRPGKF
jgi:hypothetical protein